MKTFKHLTIALFSLLLIYLVLLIVVYAIPDEWIEENVNAAIAVLESEGSYPHYFFDYPFGQSDNNTDIEMYKNLLTQDGASVLESAMVPRYSRYWHGYAVFLRPLSIILSIANIRYLNMVFLGLMLGLCFWKTAEAFHPFAAIVFVLGLVASYIWLAAFNLQYFTVSALTLLFSLAILLGYHRIQNENLPVLFLCFGSVTYFMDYLTFPILTLGYPLVLLLLLRKRNLKHRTFITETVCLLSCSATWSAGYVATAFAKGLFGTLFTDSNVLQEVLENAINRIDGALPDGYSQAVSALMSLSYNLPAFFNSRNLGAFIACIVFFGWFAYRWRSSLQTWLSSLPLLGVALFPYVWYILLQNHSVVHCYFTYKAQAVTFFAVCAFIISAINFSAPPRKALFIKTKPRLSVNRTKTRV